MENSDVRSVNNEAGPVPVFKRSKLAAAIGIAGVMLVAGMSGGAFAAPGGTPGKPDSGGMAPPDYGDLIIIKRFDNGVPDLDENDCWQPIASDSELCSLTAGSIVPVAPDTCAVLQPTCTEEVDFGRINEARSPDSVFQQQLDDAVIKLATADCRALDPAGRLVAKTDVGDIVDASTIDSPLQNLAMYRQLVINGTLGTPFPGDDEPLIAAARALGAASDKSGGVNVDMVAYLNWIMGVVDAVPESRTICQDRKQEVKGVIQMVEECFLDYGSFPVYNRALNFAGLPNPPYIPEDVPIAGWFEYLTTQDAGQTFFIDQGPIDATVFQGGYSGANIGGFAQAADDARAVIDFMHSNPVPEAYETKMPTCADSGTPPSGDPRYDVYISDVSGLQVPVQIVDGSEGREFSVTVANSGPDAASGTVTVTAEAANGVPIAGSPWTFEFSVVAGASQGFTEFFTINLGERTTIDWTATVTAEFDFPVTNNTVTAVSTVKVTGSGGGSGGGQPPGAGGPPNAGGQPPAGSGSAGNAKGKP
jgi:hypothetical protein